MIDIKKLLAGLVSVSMCFAVVIASTVAYLSGVFGTDEAPVPPGEVTEGIFLDRNGIEITSYSPEGKNHPAVLNFSKSMSHLIGYNSTRLGTSGLRNTLKNYILTGGKDDTGATITLTVDAYLQEALCSLLDGHKGSISIVNAKTGEILVLLSRSNSEVLFEADRVDEAYARDKDGKVLQYYSDYYNSIDGLYINMATLAEDSGGSVIKVITAYGLLSNGMGELTYYDADGTFLDGKIHNYAHAPYYETDLGKALINSSNVYFANAALTLGNKRMRDTFSTFMLGNEITLDFTTLNSNYANAQYLDDFILASTGYGQGQLQISPLHIASIIGTVVSGDGRMMKPYLIDNIADDGKQKEGTKKEVLTVIDTEVSHKLKELLASTAESYGLYDGFNKEDVTIIAKSGTAETWRNNGNHTYFGVGVEFGDNAYGICIDFVDEDVMSSSLIPCVNKIINELITACDIRG